MECRRDIVTGLAKREDDKNMMVKQHLLFILYGLCADVLKGEDAAAGEDGRGVAAKWRRRCRRWFWF